MKHILVTGGAGYIGSHTVAELIVQGYDVTIVDNFENSSPQTLLRLEQLVHQDIPFYRIDIRDRNDMELMFAENDFDAVIHFAGLKSVGESVAEPWLYYDTNVYGTMVLLDMMKGYHVHHLVFSSSATVYKNQGDVAITEDTERGPINPYGKSKAIVEDMLSDFAHADPTSRFISLRYFNPVGAHPSNVIGEDPNGVPANLAPYITGVLAGRFPAVNVFGNDYPTRDGTGLRDYIHVCDLAFGHVAALKYLEHTSTGYTAVNLGTGNNTSVLELIDMFEKVSGLEIPYHIADRREGDIAVCYADPSLAAELLGWTAFRDVEMMCRSAWEWQKKSVIECAE